MKYYLGQRDAAHLWKCQPNNWLPRRVKMKFEQIFLQKGLHARMKSTRWWSAGFLSPWDQFSRQVRPFQWQRWSKLFFNCRTCHLDFQWGLHKSLFWGDPIKALWKKHLSIIFQFGKHGILWSLLEFPLVFIPTDYITYWLHRSCLCQVFFVGFANHHPIHWHQTNQWTK